MLAPVCSSLHGQAYVAFAPDGKHNAIRRPCRVWPRIKLPAYERADVREVWLVHPTDQVVSVYLLQDGIYARPTVGELAGSLAARAVTGLIIDWGQFPPP